jgi:hypothetical protein
MAYSDKEKEKIFNDIFESIENGNSLRKSLIAVGISSRTFYQWIDEDEEKVKQYARATEERAEALLDEMLDIVDNTSQDYVDVDMGEGEPSEILATKKPNYELIQRSRLRYDARKWLVSKLNPKKYGDKVDVTSAGEKIQPPSSISVEIVMPKEE